MRWISRALKSAPPYRFGVVRLKTPAASSRSMVSWGMRRCCSAAAWCSRSQGCSAITRSAICRACGGSMSARASVAIVIVTSS